MMTMTSGIRYTVIVGMKIMRLSILVHAFAIIFAINPNTYGMDISILVGRQNRRAWKCWHTNPVEPCLCVKLNFQYRFSWQILDQLLFHNGDIILKYAEPQPTKKKMTPIEKVFLNVLLLRRQVWWHWIYSCHFFFFITIVVSRPQSTWTQTCTVFVDLCTPNNWLICNTHNCVKIR